MSRVSKPSNLFIVPFSVWWDGFRGLITPALPPEGSDATLLCGLAGFTALASGLNWYVMNHYRDKGYGTGHRTGFIAGLRGERREVAAVGVTFPDDEKNAALWKRWMGYRGCGAGRCGPRPHRLTLGR